MNSIAIVNGMKSLIEGLKGNIWPDAFFTGLLGLSKETADKLPKFMFYYIVIYAVAAVICLALHYGKKQKSFSDLARKMLDCICSAVAVLLDCSTVY